MTGLNTPYFRLPNAYSGLESNLFWRDERFVFFISVSIVTVFFEDCQVY